MKMSYSVVKLLMLGLVATPFGCSSDDSEDDLQSDAAANLPADAGEEAEEEEASEEAEGEEEEASEEEDSDASVEEPEGADAGDEASDAGDEPEADAGQADGGTTTPADAGAFVSRVTALADTPDGEISISCIDGEGLTASGRRAPISCFNERRGGQPQGITFFANPDGLDGLPASFQFTQDDTGAPSSRNTLFVFSLDMGDGEPALPSASFESARFNGTWDADTGRLMVEYTAQWRASIGVSIAGVIYVMVPR